MTLLKIFRRKTQKKKTPYCTRLDWVILAEFLRKNYSNSYSLKYSKLLTLVNICTMILCTVKNTVEVKQAYLFYIRHVQVTPTDNSFNPQAVFKLTYLCQFTTAFHYSTGKSEAKTAISLLTELEILSSYMHSWITEDYRSFIVNLK